VKTAPFETDASCRLPLLVLFVSAAVWLAIGSSFSIIASLKLHNPNFLADCSWLTYGRVRPAANNCLLYGFCLQSALGVVLWLLARLGGAAFGHNWLVTVGAKLWNLGMTVGILGILVGDATGFENLELPRYAALVLFVAYLMIAIWGLLTFHVRQERQLYVSHWFLLAALFWFPWIYSTANLLLITFPVRGMAQAVVAWWYSQNLLVVWLGLVGLGTIFHFIPSLTDRPLHSRHLALITFWALILFGSWGGIPNGASLPAWIPAISTVGTVLSGFAVLTLALNLCSKVGRVSPSAPPPAKHWLFSENVSLRFIGIGVVAFIITGLLNIACSFNPVSQITAFTWFVPAQNSLNVYGFFAMAMFGAIYYILPRLTGLEFPSPRLVFAHFWVAVIGMLFIVVPLAIGGIVQGFKFRDPHLPFMEILKSILPFLRASTLGDLLLLLGHLIFLRNLVGMVNEFYRARALSAYTTATSPLFEPAEVKR
jgi:cytochrome c oxidase cbb3-type subunit 1